MKSFWDRHWEKNKCTLVNYETSFSAYNREDYKRCVCWNWGNGEEDCPQTETFMCSWQGDVQLSKKFEIPIFSNGGDLEINMK